MAAAQAVSIEQYLTMTFEHDMELVNGELKERPMPTKLHGFVQQLLGAWFERHMDEWDIHMMSETRTRVNSEDVRLPDVAVCLGELTPGKTLDEPPLIAIEILSPDDSFADLRDRAEDFAGMGVRNIWLLDSGKRIAFSWNAGAWMPASELRVSGSPVYLDLGWLWGRIPPGGQSRPEPQA